jgi:hypothetical protein
MSSSVNHFPPQNNIKQLFWIATKHSSHVSKLYKTKVVFPITSRRQHEFKKLTANEGPRKIPESNNDELQWL